MSSQHENNKKTSASTRRQFLTTMGIGGVAGSLASAEGSVEQGPMVGKIGMRALGNTGLKVSEIGFGGHSWAYAKVPKEEGGFRKTSVDEATEMIECGLDMGVNLFDSCTDLRESSVPGEALARLKARDKAIIIVRVSHKMKGIKTDRKEIYKWLEDRLSLWQTDYIDLLMLCNTEDDTPRSGYWDMSYSMEALDKLKDQGKIGYTGFGCHFPPEIFLEAFAKFGDYFDVCSLPYNVRHRAAEQVVPAAQAKDMGVITIKPFARGSLLKNKDFNGSDAGLPRDMVAFVLENSGVASCVCGVHTLAQVKENFSASWRGLDDTARERLQISAQMPCDDGHAWLEEGWRYA
jgi:uncharacterized protein